MSDGQQLHAVVRGRVQGVGFRYTTLRRAHALGLVGWVANRGDGAVEVVAEGARPALDTFLEFLHVGPPAADVHDVALQWTTATGEFRTFDVRS
jgi:acylphosphatase